MKVSHLTDRASQAILALGATIMRETWSMLKDEEQFIIAGAYGNGAFRNSETLTYDLPATLHNLETLKILTYTLVDDNIYRAELTKLGKDLYEAAVGGPI